MQLYPVDEPDKLHHEMLHLQENIELRTQIIYNCDFWSTIALNNSYPNLLSVYKRIRCSFGTSYLCESAFSHMKKFKPSERSLLTDFNLAESMMISLSHYEPDLQKLTDETMAQGSH